MFFYATYVSTRRRNMSPRASIRIGVFALVMALYATGYTPAQEPASGRPSASSSRDTLKEAAAQRAVLWRALRAACTKRFGAMPAIRVYGENDALTAICFATGDKLYIYVMSPAGGGFKDISIEPEIGSAINRITCFIDEAGQNLFRLWVDDQTKPLIRAAL